MTTRNIDLPTAPEETHPLNSRPKTVLVVDDNPRLLTAVTHLVAALGYPTLSATGGREAITLYSSRRAEIGCVLLDLTMPEMDGQETFDRLRAIDPEVRVVLSSGYGEPSTRRRFPGEVPAAFLQKPYLEEDLQAALQKTMCQPSPPPAKTPR